MKIVQSATKGDFYESFSDLIFGTLIIFLVVVMALVLKVREESRIIDENKGGLITVNRFTGGSDEPRYYFATIRWHDRPMIAFIPAHIDQWWGIQREAGRNDPVLEICQLFLERKLGLVDAETFVAMGDGISSRLANSMIHCGAGYIVTLVRILAFTELQKDRSADVSPIELRDAIGGIEVGWQNQWEGVPPTFECNEQLMQVVNWLTYNQSRNHHARAFDIAGTPQRLRAQKNGPRSADIRFRVSEDDKVKIGGATLDANTLIAFLSSVTPGSNFIIEYVSDSGDVVQPPRWVEEEILFPLGFDGRIVRESNQ